MNNTSRLKIYLILAAVVLVVVGVVWFYPRNHSSKVRSTRTVVANKQIKQPLPSTQPVTSSTQQVGMTDKQLGDEMIKASFYITRGLGSGKFLFPGIVEKLDLTSEQQTQLKDTLDALRSRVMEMLSDAATYQRTDDCTIVIQTGLSQAQTEEVENLLNTELRNILGDDKLRLLGDTADRCIRDYISLLGSSDRKYTIIGMDRDDLLRGKHTEQPLITAEGFLIKSRYTVVDGEFPASQEPAYQCISKDSFIEQLGKMGDMGAVVLKMMKEADN